MHVLRSGSLGRLDRGAGDNHMQVPTPCPHGGLVYVHRMLERMGHVALG